MRCQGQEGFGSRVETSTTQIISLASELAMLSQRSPAYADGTVCHIREAKVHPVREDEAKHEKGSTLALAP